MRCACSTAGSASCQERDDSPWHGAVHDGAFLKWTALIHMWVACITEVAAARGAGSVPLAQRCLHRTCLASVFCECGHGLGRRPVNNRSDDKAVKATPRAGRSTRRDRPARGAGGPPRAGCRARRGGCTPRETCPSACQPRHRTYRDIVCHTHCTRTRVFGNMNFSAHRLRERPGGPTVS